ncbi:cyclic-di-AMP-binding protein CbpB [Effusibacillus dendaii]|uniref:CBS domain-containing protein n=1 Tax=Effusibacillus dendaii TaxID=2743772 RepID=A0A7I8D914_9BACL|nr:cyclic-di-AMP-binding protein CbpB [Effusibacillus dendaii]BCJ86638.1 CBS domain-containing protein [Effusibacillus dendaii]
MITIDVLNKLLLEQEIKQLIIPARDVANVLLGNSLEHALLVLTHSGYSAIPVLDLQDRIHGLITSNMIFNSMLGVKGPEYEKLEGRKVEDVMNRKVPRLKETESFFRALELSINNPFICMENEQGRFSGILTRRSILALLYRHFRNG